MITDGLSVHCVLLKYLLRKFIRDYTNMVFDAIFSKISFSVKAQEKSESEPEAEEDIIDPQEVLREECRKTEHCKHLAEIYQQCNDRVNSKSQTTETCTEELIDMLHAIDHCVTPKLFSHLK